MSAQAPLRIAAIIPTYKRAALVSRSIDSVLAQTRPVDEVIVVDDGSPDNTAEVVAAYGDRVRYVRQNNGGLSAARNTGVRVSTCDWVAFLDDDDEWLPNKIEKQIEALEQTPDAVLCYTSLWCHGIDGVIAELRPNPPNRLFPDIRLKTPFTPISVMVRKDVFNEVGGFNETLKCVEDWEFFIRLVPGRTVAMAGEPLVRVYMDPNSMSKQAKSMLDAELSILDKLLVGLKGPSRVMWRLRILSKMYYRAALTTRQRQENCWPVLIRSLLYWPFPLFEPKRFKTAAIELMAVWR